MAFAELVGRRGLPATPIRPSVVVSRTALKSATLVTSVPNCYDWERHLCRLIRTRQGVDQGGEAMPTEKNHSPDRGEIKFNSEAKRRRASR